MVKGGAPGSAMIRALSQLRLQGDLTPNPDDGVTADPDIAVFPGDVNAAATVPRGAVVHRGAVRGEPLADQPRREPGGEAAGDRVFRDAEFRYEGAGLVGRRFGGFIRPDDADRVVAQQVEIRLQLQHV